MIDADTLDIPPLSPNASLADFIAENERLHAKVRELRGYYEEAMKYRISKLRELSVSMK